MSGPIPEQTRDRIEQLYRSGLSIAAVVKAVAVSEPTVSKILKSRGIEIRRGNYQSLPLDVDQLNAEYKAGASTYDLSRKYNCSQPAIARRIRQLRPESERNARSEESKIKIADSCKALWQDEEYKEKQGNGLKEWIDSGEAARISAANYHKTLGKWIQTPESKEVLSKTAKENWERKNEHEKKAHADRSHRLGSRRSVLTLSQRFVDFKDRAADVHSDRYDYSKSKYSNAITEIEIICHTHGSFWQRPYSHVDGHGCPKCADTSLDTTDFIKRSHYVHQDKYDYSRSEYVNFRTKIEIICKEHGIFLQSPSQHLDGHGCPKCSHAISKPHQKALSLFPHDIHIVNNGRDVLDGLEIDLYCPALEFGVEIHGAYWHSCRINNSPRHNTYKRLHSIKAQAAERTGITLYQFWDFEINDNPELIKSMIWNRCGLSNRIYARQCEIKKLTNRQVSGFFNRSHLQGHRPASETYGLLLDDEIQCAASFSRHDKYEWEVMRYACKLGTTVVAGFARLFKQFQKELSPQSVLTFADRRFSTGELYSKNGFELVEDTAPNYFYVRGVEILSRQRCQKHRLQKLLGPNFNPQLSERGNMLVNGFGRVYDAGHKKMLWNKP